MMKISYESFKATLKRWRTRQDVCATEMSAVYDWYHMKEHTAYREMAKCEEYMDRKPSERTGEFELL